jgi:hypothetical protein
LPIMLCSRSLLALAFALCSTTLVSAQVQINTPATALETCNNKRITWTGGTPPYNVRAVRPFSFSCLAVKLTDVLSLLYFPFYLQ